MKKLIITFLSFLALSFAYSQQSKNLQFLVDSLPHEHPFLLKLPVDKGFMAVERIEISNNDRELYYGVRNGYDSNSVAEIKKIKFSKKKWSKPEVVFPDSSGAPALSDNGEMMLFFSV